MEGIPIDARSEAVSEVLLPICCGSISSSKCLLRLANFAAKLPVLPIDSVDRVKSMRSRLTAAEESSVESDLSDVGVVKDLINVGDAAPPNSRGRNLFIFVSWSGIDPADTNDKSVDAVDGIVENDSSILRYFNCVSPPLDLIRGASGILMFGARYRCCVPSKFDVLSNDWADDGGVAINFVSNARFPLCKGC